MAARYCYKCALKHGMIVGGLPADVTGSAYQAGKYLKHTVPSTSAQTTGIFTDPSYKAYAGYMISSSASGSIEVDDSGRTNQVWYAGQQVGFSWIGGKPVVPADAVKLVLGHDSAKVHAFPVSSVNYNGEQCIICGDPVLS
jgi:hypothetical protein